MTQPAYSDLELHPDEDPIPDRPRQPRLVLIVLAAIVVAVVVLAWRLG